MASYNELRAQANPEELVDNDEREVLNPNTILSSFDDKLTLLKWLKKLIGEMEDIHVQSFTWDNQIEASGRFRLIVTYVNGEVQYSDYLSIPTITSVDINNLF